jgi:prepilin-type N-terminal cleavage/methylation domain-containing protein
MALKNRTGSKRERGMSLIELMIAIIVLMVGILGCAAAIPFAIGTNYKSRQQSNSTAIAQLITEKIMSVPAGTSPTLTIFDCSGGAGNAVNTAGSAAGTGANLQGSTQANPGDIDFSQGTGIPAGYSMSYTTCGTNGQQAVYDVRWNIKSPSPDVKQIVVGAKLQGGISGRVFALPVSIRALVGQGS